MKIINKICDPNSHNYEIPTLYSVGNYLYIVAMCKKCGNIINIKLL